MPRRRPGLALRSHPCRRSGAIAAAALLVIAIPATGVGPEDPDRPALDAHPAGRTTSSGIYYPLTPRRGTPGTTAVETAYPEDLLRRFMDLHTAGRYGDAAEIALRLVAAAPDVPLTHYNLACVMSRLKRIDEACDALDRAVDAGWHHAEHTRLDPDLASLRARPRFAALVRRMDALAAAERPARRPLRIEDDAATIIADLRREVPEIIREERLPGAVVAYVRDGAVIAAEAFGYRDAEARAPLAGTDRFDLTRPAQLFALLGAAAEDERGSLSLAEALRMSIELRDGIARREQEDRRDGAASTVLLTARMRLPTSSPGTIAYDLLRFELEYATDMSYRPWCREHLFPQLGLTATDFHRRRPRRTEAAAEAPATEPAPGDTATGDTATGDTATAVTGHSIFGTPVEPPQARRRFRRAGEPVRTTAEDLGRVVGRVMGTGDPLVERIIAAAATCDRTGLALNLIRTSDGPLLHLEEDADGHGCLLRWYPRARIGVVVLVNGEQGLDAAARIAHLALGGAG